MAVAPAFVYILICADGTYYTGWTNDIERRLSAHNRGIGARYTCGRLPVKVVYVEECTDRQMAQRREAAIKHLDRRGKEKLIAEQKN